MFAQKMYYVKDIAQRSGDSEAIDVPISASRLFRIVDWTTKFSIIGYNLYAECEPGTNDIF